VSWCAIVNEQSNQLKVGNITMLIGESYTMFREILAERKYDVVIIDGSQKRQKIFADLMNLEGLDLPRLVVFDDTDRPENMVKIPSNRDSNYCVRIFRGFKPLTVHACETTVLKIPTIDNPMRKAWWPTSHS